MISVHPALKEDYQGLVSFLKSFPNETRGRDFWQRRLSFWWDENPAFSGDIERGYVLRDRERIVGFLGCVPTWMRLGGVKTTVLNSTTWRVLPEYRMHSLELFRELIKASKDTLLFDTTAGGDVTKILKFLHFNPIVESSIDKYFFVNLPIIASLHLSLIHSRIKKTYQIKEVNVADSTFDALWKELERDYQNTNLRTAEVLNWYCFKNPYFKKLLLGCYNSLERLLGYMVCMDVWHKDTRRLVCIDFFGHRLQSVFDPLLKGCLDYAVRNRYDAFVFPCLDNSLKPFLENKLFFKRSKPSSHFFRAGSVSLTGKSYFAYAQGDVGL